MKTVALMSLISVATLFTACVMKGRDNPLVAAAAAGRIQELDSLLDQGANPNGGEDGVPLIAAARNGRIEAIRLLIERGADPNRRGGINGWTPAMHAIHKRRIESLEQLLKGGADVNARTKNGLTALIMASGDGSLEIVRLLLSRGADPYARTHEGITALTMAVSGGSFSDIDRPLLGRCQTELVKLLLSAAPDLKLNRSFGTKYALFFARLKGCSEVLRLVENRQGRSR